ncbi:expressed unknown protein [Seminavis robusta]|uniref:C2 domain-containing protein n=1 Tax=Seminavis robusta TaxID=568900 RepID=A0A9N8HRQ7_9STRA|nr:expressed unknown protein [Seminavis robusta]|eukprot:Sro1426_g271730.1 n/a (1064) ;mRNA; r:18710-22077
MHGDLDESDRLDQSKDNQHELLVTWNRRNTGANGSHTQLNDAQEEEDDEEQEELEQEVEVVKLKLTVLQGDQLVPKDRNVLGQWTTSDPYVKCSFFPEGVDGIGMKSMENGTDQDENARGGSAKSKKKKKKRKSKKNAERGEITLGQSEVIRYTLSPKWDFQVEIEFAVERLTEDAQFRVTIMDWDEDLIAGVVPSDDDLMGVVPVNVTPNLYQNLRNTTRTKWYGVPATSASRASGRIQCRLDVTKIHKKTKDIMSRPIPIKPIGKPILNQATYKPSQAEKERKKQQKKQAREQREIAGALAKGERITIKRSSSISNIFSSMSSASTDSSGPAPEPAGGGAGRSFKRSGSISNLLSTRTIASTSDLRSSNVSASTTSNGMRASASSAELKSPKKSAFRSMKKSLSKKNLLGGLSKIKSSRSNSPKRNSGASSKGEGDNQNTSSIHPEMTPPTNDNTQGTDGETPKNDPQSNGIGPGGLSAFASRAASSRRLELADVEALERQDEATERSRPVRQRSNARLAGGVGRRSLSMRRLTVSSSESAKNVTGIQQGDFDMSNRRALSSRRLVASSHLSARNVANLQRVSSTTSTSKGMDESKRDSARNQPDSTPKRNDSGDPTAIRRNGTNESTNSMKRNSKSDRPSISKRRDISDSSTIKRNDSSGSINSIKRDSKSERSSLRNSSRASPKREKETSNSEKSGKEAAEQLPSQSEETTKQEQQSARSSPRSVRPEQTKAVTGQAPQPPPGNAATAGTSTAPPATASMRSSEDERRPTGIVPSQPAPSHDRSRREVEVAPTCTAPPANVGAPEDMHSRIVPTQPAPSQGRLIREIPRAPVAATTATAAASSLEIAPPAAPANFMTSHPQHHEQHHEQAFVAPATPARIPERRSAENVTHASPATTATAMTGYEETLMQTQATTAAAATTSYYDENYHHPQNYYHQDPYDPNQYHYQPEYNEVPPPVGDTVAGFYQDAEGETYYLDQNGVEYYKDKDGNWYADYTPGGEQVCSDGAGWFEDAEGVPFYVDDNGVEYYQEADGEWYGDHGQHLPKSMMVAATQAAIQQQ